MPEPVVIHWSERNLSPGELDKAEYYLPINRERAERITQRKPCPNCGGTIGIITDKGTVRSFIQSHIECLMRI